MFRVRKQKKKRNIIRYLIYIFIIVFLISGWKYYNYQQKKINDIKLVGIINSHYNTYIKTAKETDLYNNLGEVIGKINKDIELTLKNLNIDKNTKYFKVADFKNTYIRYQDVETISNLSPKNNRYKKYIPFNKSVITKNKVTFKDEYDNYLYTLNESYELPIIINDSDKYGVEFNEQLLYIDKNDVEEVIDNNIDSKNVNGVGVLNYHFFYDDNDPDAIKNCNEIICASKSDLQTHIDFLKNNDIFAITMNELELYMDGKLQLPRSVLITIDDGGRNEVGIDMLSENKLNFTVFLITSWYNPRDYYETDYIELHSHSHDMHDGGECPGGQGSGIKCLPRDYILEDLRKSRESLGGSTAFCYPFYEYNKYSENLLKEAGFTMAFIGEVGASYGPYKLAEVGGDKMKIPRFVVTTYTTLNDLKIYFNEIK